MKKAAFMTWEGRWDQPGWGMLAAVGAMAAQVPLLFLIGLLIAGDDFLMLILPLNTGLGFLLWGMPAAVWIKLKSPYFAQGWMIAAALGGLINGACLATMMR